MARIFVTGSADGLGRTAAQDLLDDAHEIVVHARSNGRLTAVRDLVERGAASVVGNLADLDDTRGVAEQVNLLGRMDALIHNAAVDAGSSILPLNVIAPYLLTVLLHRPSRLMYLSSSSMHRGRRADVACVERSGHGTSCSLLGQQALRHHCRRRRRRRWPDVFSNAVDPGWLPTRMGGPGASDELYLGPPARRHLRRRPRGRRTTSEQPWTSNSLPTTPRCTAPLTTPP
jgi:hypothetical protein